MHIFFQQRGNQKPTPGRPLYAAGRTPARSWAVKTSSSDSLNLARATVYDGHARCRRRSRLRPCSPHRLPTRVHRLACRTGER